MNDIAENKLKKKDLVLGIGTNKRTQSWRLPMMKEPNLGNTAWSSTLGIFQRIWIWKLTIKLGFGQWT